jgi:tetratricopeptide (TPR) repeat protein
MHLLRFVLLLAALLLASLPSFAQAPVDPADEYFRAYLLNNEAERLVNGGDLQRALDKYQQAQVIFDGIAQNTPSWQPDMLKFRRQRLDKALTDVQAKIASGPKSPAPATTAPAPVAPVSPHPTSTPLIPQMPLTPTPPPPAGPSSGDPVQDAIDALRRAMEQKMATNGDELTRALAAVGEGSIKLDAMTRLKDLAVEQRDQFYLQAAEEKKKADGLETKVVELEKSAKNAASKAELEKARKELADAKEALEDTTTRQKKAEAAVSSLTAKYSELELKLATVQKERDDLKTRPAAPDNMKQLMEEKQKLETQLATAQKEIVSLKEDATRKDNEIASLKGQLVKVQGELTTLRRENTALETQVADLTLELKKISDVKTDPSKAKPEDLPKIMAENELLKGVVIRQLRQQARMQEQKRLVIEEVNKSTNNNKSLIDQIEQMAGQRVSLSDDEKKLFSTPQLEAMNDIADLKGTFIAKADPPAGNESAKTDTPPTPPSKNVRDAKVIDDLMEKGNKLLADGKLTEAEAAYRDVIRADAKNTTALAGLAWSLVQQNKLDEAEATLRKALSYDENNSSAHYMLAVALFRRDKSQDAIAAFEKSLSINPKNARAHHYLGVITSKLGLTPRAEKEFKSALAIDPDYGEADFNLAVLYATSAPPNWELAKKHYADALKKGVKADANLEKLLNGK